MRREEYLKKLSSDEKRKVRSLKQPSGRILSGFSLFGLIGWSIAVPTVIGALLGSWLDQHHPGPYSWTLSLLVAGLTLGCFNAWNWLNQEESNITMKENKEPTNIEEPTTTKKETPT